MKYIEYQIMELKMQIKHEYDSISGKLRSGEELIFTYPDDDHALGNIAFSKDGVEIDADIESLALFLDSCGFTLEKKRI